MAIRAQPLRPLDKAGAVLAALVCLLVIGPLVAVGLRADASSGLGAGDWAAIRFTLLQALVSAALSVACAIPVARALARRRFAGRSAFVTLLGAPFILPVIVAVLGLLTVFGRAGWLNDVLAALGAGRIDIYGLTGVVLAHVFLNLPLAVRLLLQAWLAVPAERVRLAHTLGFSGRDMQRHFERPILWATLPGVALVIFLICTTSFAVALTLGGGPQATTIELAIYQAFRFDFDLGRAATLSVVQVAICVVAVLLMLRGTRPEVTGAALDRPAMMWPGDMRVAQLWDVLVLIAAALFLIVPMVAVLLKGVPALIGLPGVVWAAAARSIVLALVATGLCVLWAVPIASFAARGRGVVEVVGFLTIAVSPLVIGTGMFIIVFEITSPVALALPITAMVNALIALPFVLRALIPEMRRAEATQGRLADALGLSGLSRLRHVLLPRLRRPLGFGAGLTAALSMGDLGVIALFSSPGQSTLPMEMYRLFGAYRTHDAQGAAVVLMALSLGMFWLFDRGGRTNAAV